MNNKETEENIKCTLSKIPFKISLSFEYLIQDIEKIALNEKHPMNLMAQQTCELINNHNEFKSSNIDIPLVEKNPEIVERLMSFVVNPMYQDCQLTAVHQPFAMMPFFASQYYYELFGDANKSLEIENTIVKDEDKKFITVLFHAYLLILDKIYHLDLFKDKPFTFKLIDRKSKLVKFFSTVVNGKYIQIKDVKPHKKLDPDEIKSLINRENDLDYWNKMIPLENYEFSGFMKIDYFDVTYDYVISQLKSELLNRSSIITEKGFDNIRKWIRSLIENPDLEVGLIAVNDFKTTNTKKSIWKSIIPYSELSCSDYVNSVYENAFKTKKIVITNDFKEEEPNVVVNAFLSKGIRSHVIVPLVLEGEVVGALEFACSKPGNLSMIQVKRLLEVYPMFALAIKRSLTEWNDKVNSIIQKEFTAIHPSVEWKFREVVEETLSGDNCEENIKVVEPIVFNDVIPIYGASDIRGSSIERNKAIQADLKDQLIMVKNILCVDDRLKVIPLVTNWCYKIDQYLVTVNKGLKAGDEITIIDFCKNEIEPIFKILKERFTDLQPNIDKYFNALDQNIGIYYNKRRDFEASLTTINEQISNILEEEQVIIQAVFPHYFEKYKTDGIEYNAYIGQSLVNDITYNDIYLRNIRLWQLLVMVKIARRIRDVQSDLKTKLDISQLILVHTSPLSIAFRQDEKKFDVDGAYNIRYEITKKRIDKALIKNSKERITQVGKIAIIYSYAEEIEEYKRYIDFLVSQNYLKETI